MVVNHLGRRIDRKVATDGLDEIAVGIYPMVSTRACRTPGHNTRRSFLLHTHQVEVNAVIDQVVLSRLHIRRGAKVHPVGLAYVFNLLPGARHA